MEEILKFVAPVFSGSALLMLGMLVRKIGAIDEKIGRIHKRISDGEVEIKQRITALETTARNFERRREMR